MNLYDKVRLAREGSAVERCHAHPHLLSYTVGQHSLDLVTLITLCWMEDHHTLLPRSALLIAAAFHDVPERITGDVPQPIKALLGARLEVMDDKILYALNVKDTLTAEEAIYLHHGDKLELWLWCWEECRRGNTGFLDWIDDYNRWFIDNRPPRSYERIMDEVRSGGGIARLDFHALKEELEL